MNILIPYSWLKEFLKTDATPKQLADIVSASGPSIERWHHTDDGDVVFDVEVTTNRTDAYSVFGLAREAFAIITKNELDADLVEPVMPPITNNSGVHYTIHADVDETLCARFTAVVLDNVSLSHSPDFIRERLAKVGERSLNAIVDITNYVMWELGQPMHAFDYDKIANQKMTLRKSAPGESLVTLDGTARKVPEGSIVIADDEKLIDLCGIMGGKNSAVDENTTRVLLLVPNYNPVVIRKTAMQMAFRTEAASRFEKGLDPELAMQGLCRAVYLLQEYTGATVVSDVIDLYPHPYQPKTVSVDFPMVQATIGEPIDIDEAVNILITLGFQVSVAGPTITAEVPSYRAADIMAGEDLIEEIARLYGYNNIPSVVPTGQIPQRPENAVRVLAMQAKRELRDWGFTELMTFSATSQANIAALNTNPKQCIKIKNPLSEDFVYMRPHLLCTMLPVISQNLPRYNEISVFELSKVYQPTKTGLPKEIRMLQLVTTNPDLLQLKGYIVQLLDDLGVANYETHPHESSDKYQGNTAIFTIAGEEIGHMGELSQAILDTYGITTPLATAKLYFDSVIEHAQKTVSYHPIPKYPAATEDISILLPTETVIGPILAAVASLDPLITKINVIDTYTGTNLGKGKKSITVRVTYQGQEKPLSEADLAPLREKAFTAIQQHGGSVRRQ